MKLTSVCLPGTKCTRGGIFSGKRVDGNGIAAMLLKRSEIEAILEKGLGE